MIDAATAFTLVEHGAGAIPRSTPCAAGYPRILTAHRRPHPTKRRLGGDPAVLAASTTRRSSRPPDCSTRSTRRCTPTAGRASPGPTCCYGYVRRATPARTTGEWLALCRELQIPASAVATLDELVAALPIIEHPVVGPYRQIPAAARFGGRVTEVRRHAALPGADTRDVLSELGLSATEIEELHADGTVDSPTGRRSRSRRPAGQPACGWARRRSVR